MPYDTLVKEAKELPQDCIQEVIDFILFLKTRIAEGNDNNSFCQRQFDTLMDDSFYMADDFDDTPAEFKEYM